MLTQKLQTLASAEESFKTCGPETVHVGGTAHIMSSIYAHFLCRAKGRAKHWWRGELAQLCHKVA